MFQINRSKPKGFSERKPLVSICTITFNRHEFLTVLKKHIDNQDYPITNIEWVIVDDSDFSIKKTILNDNNLKIKYIYLSERKPIGFKRNIANRKSSGEIIVYMDDDDYYPPNRVSHAVGELSNSRKLIAGCTQLPIFYLFEKELWISGPFNKNHGTANTFAFKKQLLSKTSFLDESQSSEESYFTKGFTIPMIQLDPFKSIFCLAHNSNTISKKNMRANPNKYRMRKIDIDDKKIKDIKHIFEKYKNFM